MATMADIDIASPLLQLNPPVLVRANGSPSVIDLAALRRTVGGANGHTAAPSPSAAGRPTPLASLAVRKLHDAKSTARQVARTAAPPRAQTTEVPGRRKASLGLQSSAATAAAAAAPHHATGGAHRQGKATVPPRAADQHGSGSAPPSPSAAAAAPSSVAGGGRHRTSLHAAGGGARASPSSETVVAAAAAASPSHQQVSLDLPYLMRHVTDTAALLDTLFPLSLPGADAAAAAGDGDREGPLLAVQTVSTAPATREDVVVLHATLRARLEARRARPTGLCPIRRAIYSDLFSELVRQVTVEEPVRGLLLARVRENEEHAIQVHAALLREGESFVANKLLQSTESASHLRERLAALQQEKTVLEVRKHNLEEVQQTLKDKFEAARQARHAQQQDELNYLRRANQQLSLRLKIETERASASGGAAGPADAAAHA